ncbi:MAG: polyribonucleotide nucleotidyltransferase [Synergistetes bacterium]|nr:polyribonucleotide nucleotidyltransferase [Synergistota bacterium]
MIFEKKISLGEGKELVFQLGKVAKQANGAVWVKFGDNVVLVTAVMSDKPREGIDFFPLLVDYEERFYAAGKIPGGYIKREGKPSDEAILSARLIDRPIRPLFPEGFFNDVHVVATVLSVDMVYQPDILAINGASLALVVSDIPFMGPIAAVRVGMVDGNFVVNPTSEELERSSINLTVAGKEEGIVMVEAGAKEVSEDVMVDAIEFGFEYIKKIIDVQKEIASEIGKEKIAVQPPEKDEEFFRKVVELARDGVNSALDIHSKKDRNRAISLVKADVMNMLGEEYAGRELEVNSIVDELVKAEMRRRIVEEGRRVDGRSYTDIRPITCEVGILPRTHGSALFTRGETQALVTTTLGMVGEEQLIDGLSTKESKKFILHYNFPPYSVGEVRPMRGPGRREIGHGALAERAILAVMPSEAEFPYTVRVVSEILESNGSSSMATVCGSSMALMDAGVPLKAAVAGIAMGLIQKGDKTVVLSDILGMEDHYGDMDFKVAGTTKGVTALQMDIKVPNISTDTMRRALRQAHEGRMFILDKMSRAIDKPRESLSPYAPSIIVTTISPDKISSVIGPGGRVIKDIIERTGVKIDIEQDGTVYIASTTQEGGQEALEIIKDITTDYNEGDVLLGKVVRTTDFGAFVQLPNGKEGLLHISEIDHRRIRKVEDELHVGDEVMVKVKNIDKLGRINLSRKELLPKSEQQPERRPKNYRGRRHSGR